MKRDGCTLKTLQESSSSSHKLLNRSWEPVLIWMSFWNGKCSQGPYLQTQSGFKEKTTSTILRLVPLFYFLMQYHFSPYPQKLGTSYCWTVNWVQPHWFSQQTPHCCISDLGVAEPSNLSWGTYKRWHDNVTDPSVSVCWSSWKWTQSLSIFFFPLFHSLI